jgi:hypothetical protein
MRRVLVLLIALALLAAMSVVAVAAPPCDKNPNHPDCIGTTTTSTTEPPEIGPCIFTDGELEVWDGSREFQFGYRCEWDVDSPYGALFQMRGDPGAEIRNPHLIVHGRPTGYPICFNQNLNGWQDPAVISWEVIDLDDSRCITDPLNITVSGTARYGTVNLILTMP